MNKKLNKFIVKFIFLGGLLSFEKNEKETLKIIEKNRKKEKGKVKKDNNIKEINNKDDNINEINNKDNIKKEKYGECIKIKTNNVEKEDIKEIKEVKKKEVDPILKYGNNNKNINFSKNDKSKNKKFFDSIESFFKMGIEQIKKDYNKVKKEQEEYNEQIKD